MLVIHQSDAQLDLMDAWNKGTHGRSGLIDKVRASTVTEAQAEQQILEFVAQLRAQGQHAHVRQHHRPGPALPGEVHAQAGGLLPLPQPGRQHAQGAGQALAARGATTPSRSSRSTRRWPTCTSPSTSLRTTASTSCKLPAAERGCGKTLNRAIIVGLAAFRQRIVHLPSRTGSFLHRTRSQR